MELLLLLMLLMVVLVLEMEMNTMVVVRTLSVNGGIVQGVTKVAWK